MTRHYSGKFMQMQNFHAMKFSVYAAAIRLSGTKKIRNNSDYVKVDFQQSIRVYLLDYMERQTSRGILKYHLLERKNVM